MGALHTGRLLARGAQEELQAAPVKSRDPYKNLTEKFDYKNLTEKLKKFRATERKHCSMRVDAAKQWGARAWQQYGHGAGMCWWHQTKPAWSYVSRILQFQSVFKVAREPGSLGGDTQAAQQHGPLQKHSKMRLRLE